MSSKRRKQKRRAVALDSEARSAVASAAVKTADAFSNPLTRAGFGMPNALEFTQYPMTRYTQNYQEINSLYRSHWVVQRIINTIPQDMMKNGYDLISDIDPDQEDKIWRVIKQTRLHHQIIRGLQWGRLYGGAAGIILIKGDEERLEEPVDLDIIEPDSFKGLLIVDRWSGISPGSELITDINNPDFGMPAFYDITLDGGLTMRIHNSRVCRFIGREMPYFEKLAENYWGTSELEHVISELRKRDNVSWNIALLTFMANIRVLKMEGMGEILALGGDKAQEQLYNTIEGMNMLLNNNAMQILGENDEYQQHQYGFSGLSDIYDCFMMDVSGACGIPVTKLFGRSPAGLNSTGDADMQNYYDIIEAYQESQLRPVLDKLLPIICVSTLGAVPDDLDYTFNPVRRASDTEKQDLGSQQTAAVTQAFTAGLISQKTALQELQQSSKQTGMWTNITDDEIAKADDDTTAAGEDMPMPPGIGDSANQLGQKASAVDADFDKEAHPRDDDGKFVRKIGSGEAKKNSQITRINAKVLLEAENEMRTKGLLKKGESLVVPEKIYLDVPTKTSHGGSIEERHGVTLEQAQHYVDTAVVGVKQSKDKFAYIASDGTTVFIHQESTKTGRITTAWSVDEYNEPMKKKLEVALKWASRTD